MPTHFRIDKKHCWSINKFLDHWVLDQQKQFGPVNIFGWIQKCFDRSGKTIKFVAPDFLIDPKLFWAIWKFNNMKWVTLAGQGDLGTHARICYCEGSAGECSDSCGRSTSCLANGNSGAKHSSGLYWKKTFERTAQIRQNRFLKHTVTRLPHPSTPSAYFYCCYTLGPPSLSNGWGYARYRATRSYAVDA